MNETALRNADLNLLLLYHVVLRERHVGRAAHALHLSPSAVSHGLGRLRELLGDPLFLRTPKGVVPTAKAEALAAPIAALLEQAHQLLATREPFVPANSHRHFTLGTLDAPAIDFLPPLLADIRAAAPGVRINVKLISMTATFDELDAHRIDIGVLPMLDEVPARFATHRLYEEEFVVVARTGHPYWKQSDLRNYCRMSHVLVAPEGGERGFVDDALEARGLARHIAVVVPNFLLGITIVAAGDFIATMPRRVVERHAKRFRLQMKAHPLRLQVPQSDICVIAPKVALNDEGIAWLYGLLSRPAT